MSLIFLHFGGGNRVTRRELSRESDLNELEEEESSEKGFNGSHEVKEGEQERGGTSGTSFTHDDEQEEPDSEIDMFEDEPKGEADPSEMMTEAHSRLYNFKHRMPHLYYISTHLVLPLMTLIGMAFLFGGILAKIEMKGEIESNDAATRNVFLKYMEHIADRQSIYSSMANTSVQCLSNAMGNDAMLEAFPDNLIQTTENISDCAAERAQDLFPITLVLPFLVSSGAELTFNWMNCWKENTIGDENATRVWLQGLGLNEHNNNHQQKARYLHRFGNDFVRLRNQTGITTQRIFANKQVVLELVRQATGSRGCEVHIAGGALFWFTLMTTIGYGNTAPESDEGRFLVCTAGFLTIILFLALNNTAAQVWKNMFDHFFLKLHQPNLVRGPLSVLFWLAMSFLWMLVLTGVAVAYTTGRLGAARPLKDMYWFSFVTITTVGFGDIHVRHEEFTGWDMFHFPLLVLVGFNFLGIFAEKTIDLYNDYFPEQHGYADILEERRSGKGPNPMPFSAQLMGVTAVAEC
ncbi:expressed unknown protein [Seminavis robusta]|uniref:Potassium channel domain-containing protein n=1 Tax=Seminavis robusta TaxID=568900 RepID=A0A9N8F366_9STRA|nr:expressed unknown protein [Seminavis robusta]|eukprot:Sro2889_g339510.1 n/a (520) ;mRNA; r:4955-6514